MMHLHDDPFSTLAPLAQKPEPSPPPVIEQNKWIETLHKIRKNKLEIAECHKRIAALELENDRLLEIPGSGHASQKRANKVAERYGFSGAQRTE